jgi:hypothetical protein
MMTCQLFLAAALLAPAQESTRLASVYDGLLLTTRAPGPRPVDEQIEVMRALLIRKLGGGASGMGTLDVSGSVGTTGSPTDYYPLTNQYGPGFQPGGLGQAHVPFVGQRSSSIEPAVEGTYLDGYGVVFTVTLPATGQDPLPGASGPKDGPGLSDWDREQKAQRGEPVPAKNPASPVRPPVGDVVLKLLAENGKHFTALNDDERVTIAVTFRNSVLQLHPSTFNKAALGQDSTLLGAGVNSDAGLRANIVREDRVATLENLGALHLKQGEPQRAIEAFTNAASAAEAEAKQNPAEGNERLRGALLKLSQALLAAGKLDDAREAMDRATTGLGNPPQAANSAPKTGAVNRPARLTISAPKKLLDQIGNGKISLEEFRKQAIVEYVPVGKGS